MPCGDGCFDVESSKVKCEKSLIFWPFRDFASVWMSGFDNQSAVSILKWEVRLWIGCREFGVYSILEIVERQLSNVRLGDAIQATN